MDWMVADMKNLSDETLKSFPDPGRTDSITIEEDVTLRVLRTNEDT